MKISKVTVLRGKKINLETDDAENFEIQMEALLDEQDDPQDIVQGLKSILDRHLLAWEQKIRGKLNLKDDQSPVTFTTAEELVTGSIQLENEKKDAIEQKLDNKKPEEEVLNLICPKCNEKMVKKEGKDYYLCSKHWGYPDMIKAGQVREKRF